MGRPKGVKPQLCPPEDLVTVVKGIAPKMAERDLLWAQLVFVLTNNLRKHEEHHRSGETLKRIFAK